MRIPLSMRKLQSRMMNGEVASALAAGQASLTSFSSRSFADPRGAGGRRSTGVGPSLMMGASGPLADSFSMVFSLDWAIDAPIVFAPKRSTKPWRRSISRWLASYCIWAIFTLSSRSTNHCS